jgi:hypothetical protein
MEEDTVQDFSLPTVQTATGVNADFESPQVQSQAMQIPLQPAAAMPSQPSTGGRPSMQQAIAASLPMSAQDKDLIERIWVDKAKMIVRQTYGDPFVQNKALSQVKADYIRKRYGKEIKVSE